MSTPDLVAQLLALTDPTQQQQLMEESVSLLDDSVAEALKAQADHYLRADVQKALHLAELIQFMATLTGSASQRALGLLAEGNARSIGLGEYRAANELYDTASDIYRSLDQPLQQARSQVGAIWALANLGHYAEALELGHQISHVLEEHEDWKRLAGLMQNLGIVHSRAGDDARSLEMFDRAALYYRQLGAEHEPDWLWVQQNRAVALRVLGRFNDSIEASQAAYTGLDRLEQKVSAARARQNLALTYFILGRYNEALSHLDRVRDVFLADGRHRDAMRTELFISDCLLQLRRFDDVLEKCQRVRVLFTELGTQDVVAQAIVNEGVAYAELGRYAEALESFSEARQIFKTADNRVWMASTDLETAAALLHQQRSDESLSAAQASALVFADHDLPIEEAKAKLLAARAAIAMGKIDLAAHLASEALASGTEHDVPALRYQANYLLGVLATQRGDLQGALAAYELAIEEVEQLRGHLMVEFRAGFLEDKSVIYEDIVGLYLDLAQPQGALEYAERAKSRALLDLVGNQVDLGVRARAPADQPLVDELLRLRQERELLQRRMDSKLELSERGWTGDDRLQSRIQREIVALEHRITQLWHKLLIRNADYALDASLWTIQVEPIQPYMAAGSVLLEYFTVRGEVVAFLVTADSVDAIRLGTQLSQIERLVQLLRLNIRAVPNSRIDRVGSLEENAQGILQKLHECLLAPLGGRLAAFPDLIIVPHGPLHYLPIHALYDGQRYLLESHTISHLPGASLLRYCSQPLHAARGLVTVGHSLDNQLPYTVQEAQGIAAMFGGEAILEGEATRERFRQAASDCQVLHVATHGDFRPDNPLFSGLRLSDGWLTTLDIFNLRMQASLVALSACQTGRNVVGGGDELLGLMRAFLAAGTASLILSLWAVDDQSTAQLMEAFYRELSLGSNKAQALRSAQLRFLAAPDDDRGVLLRHPYFWAPFYLVGHPGPL